MRRRRGHNNYGWGCWHKSKTLIIPQNIEVIYLPPYSPVIKHVERLCLYIKRAVFYNKIYDFLDHLENAFAAFIFNLANTTISEICNYKYMHR